MKIIFFGTPDFASASLKALVESGNEITAVVTAPDKQRGRGRRFSYTPVKQLALDYNIKVLQPEKLRDENFISQLEKIEADLFVVVAFRILPKEVFSIPEFGSFNLHASYLPKYRGAAPIQWALINGEKETGLTTFKLEEKVDTGNIYLQKKVEILENDDFQTLHDRLKALGANLVVKTVDMISEGKFTLNKQNDSEATPAPKITKEICRIDWNQPAEKVKNLVRGLSPSPGAFFEWNGKTFKVFKADIVERNDLKPGEVITEKKELFIGCIKDAVSITELQQEGKSRLGIEEFLRGFRG